MLDWANDLIEEYTVVQLELEKRANEMDSSNRADMDGLTLINSMIEKHAFLYRMGVDWTAAQKLSRG